MTLIDPDTARPTASLPAAPHADPPPRPWRRSPPPTRQFWLWCLALCLAHLSPSSLNLQAERFLTIPQAQSILFPNADSFTPQIVRFTQKEKRAIADQINQRVRTLGHRIVIARKDSQNLGLMVVDHVLGKHQLIDYAVAISPQGAVLGVEILAYRESYGDEIRQDKWREQFHGKTAESEFRLNDDIYNITGATISCRNVTDGIRRVLATYETVLKPRMDQTADAQPD